MKKLLYLSIISTILSSFLLSPCNVSAGSNSKIVLGYYAQDENAYDSLITNYSYLTQVSTDSFTFDSKGKIVGSAPKEAISFANKKNIETFAAVSNWQGDYFNAALAHKIVGDSKVRKEAIKSILNLVKTNHYKGINIDFENIEAKDRKAFSSFIGEISQTLRPKGYLTMVSVPAEFENDPTNSWSGAFDYKELGKHADYIQVMTYDQNGPWGPSGPVAGKDWMEAAIQYTISEIPLQKVIIGVPAYGYNWNETKKNGDIIALKDIPALIASTGAKPEWDESSSSISLRYQADDGSKHVVWYENAASIQEKTHLTIKYNLAGISIWSMGTEDSGFWQAISAGLKE
ncbi:MULTISPECIES: glycosyl hydrolase family 18 protein [unclassified Paenibacillus]|uniref:glycosyl hydrolase family 18 protein n=1 Tax=unclassified Paenibacillus TaxID=185978 RepID=UPI0009A8A9EA|nr:MULTISPECIES: glycosyl hydrolase family 18 protein [unclassified Paenibacillus]SLJ88519.1 Spore germination protein YaaH [Paenibacillus sp. RU5A]SOC63198.1 Spore germination protein YaaH [Paenibacillus sp. RU26A]SOC68523.1 Spore germination protein YaaH [Paenibacillus sp. RU5M]